MIPTHFGHSENLHDDEQEQSPSSHITWLAIVVMVAVLAAIILLLSFLAADPGEQPANSVATTQAG